MELTNVCNPVIVQPTMANLLKAYVYGEDAHFSLQRRSDNPYPEGSELFNEWDMGFCQAEDDDNERHDEDYYNDYDYHKESDDSIYDFPT